MRVVSHKAVRLFSRRYPDAAAPLDRWYRVVKRADWAGFADVRRTFNTADLVAPHVVFNIGGNRYRLVAEIHFQRRVLFIRDIMTHREYDKGGWKR
jgi:mRNA interferase HigB